MTRGQDGTVPGAAPAATPVPDEYVIGHIEEALGQDGRVGERGLHVEVRGTTLLVDGTVANAARKAAVVPVVEAALGELDRQLVVRDETVVANAAPPVGMEEVR